MEKDHVQTIQAELLRMSEADQVMRNQSLTTGEWDGTIDEDNTKRLKTIIADVGWPTISMVGAEAAGAAWLLPQHADHDLNFQKQCLAAMDQLPPGEVDPMKKAYLEDRVRVNTNRPQLYGTQFYREGETFGPRPIEDAEHLDERRLAIGLSLFEVYRVEMEEIDRQYQARPKVENKS